jgi:hypothetical protein
MFLNGKIFIETFYIILDIINNLLLFEQQFTLTFIKISVMWSKSFFFFKKKFLF